MKNIRLTGMIQGKQITLQQINKKVAKRLFLAGQPIYIQSSNFNPFSVWQPAIEIKSLIIIGEDFPTNTKEDRVKEFEQRINNFEYYNCSYEQGYYSHFYKVD